MNKKQNNVLFRIILSAVILGALWLAPIEGIMDGWLSFFLYLIPYGIIGYDILRTAWKGIVLGRIRTGDYVEAVAVMIFYQTGELFQSVAVGKSRRSISDLMDIRPDTANLVSEDGSVTEVSPEDVPAGSVILVNPGERVPLDGESVAGTSTLSTSALTGESRPVEFTVNPGDLEIYVEAEGRKLLEPGDYLIYAGGSCLDERVCAELSL